MEKMLQTFRGVLVLLLISLGILLLLLGKSVFFSAKDSTVPEPDEPVGLLCGNATFLDENTLQGDSIFRENCTRCHNTGDAKLVGDGLHAVYKRIPPAPENWMRLFLGNADSLYKKKDPYLRKIYRKKKKADHVSFRFSDKDWAVLSAYLKKI